MDLESIGQTLIINFGYIGLFISAILSATMLPFPVEVIMLFGIYLGLDINMSIIVTSLGSAVGATTGYYLGVKGMRKLARKWVDRQEEKKAIKMFKKYGSVSLFLSSWIPFLGDAIPIVAGTFKMKFKHYFIPLMIGKLSKFTLVAYALHFAGVF
jgi:membrane protein YqaA with SNARE-associated domain